MTTPPKNVTTLLLKARDGEPEVIDELFPLVYDELQCLARRHLRGERAGHTLDTTGLVHEAYLKLVDQDAAQWRDRTHFFALASKVMRHLLIDYARRKNAQKRGGDRVKVELEDQMVRVEEQAAELLELDRALTHLAERNRRMSQVVECRFFGGMTVEETAAALDVSTRTAGRDWARAKAHLYRMLQPSDAQEN